MDVTRNDGRLIVDFKNGMEMIGIYRGNVEIEARVDLFPLGFYESLAQAVDSGLSTYPRLNLPFRKSQMFTLERQGGLKNGEVWFKLKTTSPGFFVIELREQEIKNLLADMRKYMTR